MLDWVINIWDKPLATWTLLDLVKLVAMFAAVGLALAAVVGIVFLAFGYVIDARQASRPGAAEEREAARRRSIGYDK
jgi:hypothetical protein